MNRQDSLKALKNVGQLDVLIIGGGATGTGAALDAATRGLKVGLVERGDFASGTSSKSTKLIHGGVRYLEQAVKKLDRGQFHLVKEALAERAIMLKLAPHLSRPLSIFTPLYKFWEKPYYRIGLKMYDWLAGKANLAPSRALSRDEAIKQFPLLTDTRLKGGVLYYDGQFDDARMNVTLAMTAAQNGAMVANYLEVTSLIIENERVVGVTVNDLVANETFDIRAKSIINATGPYVDVLRLQADPKTQPMLMVSSGAHIVLAKRFCPGNTGLLIPKTQDGRVLFLLPCMGHTLAGTTDQPAQVVNDPRATEVEVDYILRHLRKYFSAALGKKDVLSSWSGLRPLVSNAHSSSTSRLSRDHVIETGTTGLITIAGGKWTTYRRMAEDVIDTAVKNSELSPVGPSRTRETPLIGAEGYDDQLPTRLAAQFQLPPDIASHLAQAYGGRAASVAALSQSGYSKRLAPQHPYIEAEVVHAMQNEMALTPSDVLYRRTRLAFLDQDAAQKSQQAVSDLMKRLSGGKLFTLHEATPFQEALPVTP